MSDSIPLATHPGSGANEQVCGTCGRSLPATGDFFYYRRDAGRYRSNCKDCFRVAKNTRYASDPERARAIARRSYHRAEGDTSKGLATKRRNRVADPDRYADILARYELAHAEERRTRRVLRHSENREEDKAKSAAWYNANRERAIATARRWIREHPERARLLVEATRSKRKSAYSTLTTDEWNAIRDRFHGLCAYCSAPATALDHVVPLAKGGDHTAENVVPACRSCNGSKAAKWLGDWLRETPHPSL